VNFSGYNLAALESVRGKIIPVENVQQIYLEDSEVR